MKVGLLISDGCDGSASIHYFKDLEYAMALLDCDAYCQDFGLNESMDIIEVPDTFSPPGGFSDYEWDLEE